jgi:integrase
VDPPKREATEVEILKPDEISTMLAALEGSKLHNVAVLALASGCRRGELLALRWSDVDLGKATIKIERSLEQTRGGGLRFKCPKTRHSRRGISLPPSAVVMLQPHRKEQLALRLKLGMGKPDADVLVFPNDLFEPWSPNSFSVMWGRAVPQVTFHSLRHAHASALIASGIDVVSVSHRLGHSGPTITLGIYAHLFHQTDTGAAAAAERLFGK